MSMYYPPFRSDEIYHWGIEKGKERKNHKYFNRILTGTKNGQNIYRYFYDKKEWDAYNANKQQRPQPVKNINTSRPVYDNTTSINSRPSFLSRLIFGEVGSRIIEKGKELVSKLLNMDSKDDTAQPLPNDYKIEIPEDEKAPPKVTTDNVNIIEQRIAAADKYGGIENPEGEDKYKYVAKIPMGDGTFRYFYDKESLAGYYKEINDPLYEEFGVREETNISEEDRKNINERYHESYDYFNEQECAKHAEYTNNCYSCTTAFELRRRGYDVDAINDPDGESWETVVSMYENPTIKSYDCINKSRDESIQDIMKDMIAEGDGARGNLCVYWSGGGGHSIAWEVVDGAVQIIDNQTDDIYKGNDVKEFFEYVDLERWNQENIMVTPEGFWDRFHEDPDSKPFYDMINCNPVQWVRTDNCELNTKKIKQYVRKDY